MINTQASIETNMIVTTENKILSFSDYLLNESIKIQPTDYGLNNPYFNNKKTGPTQIMSFHSWHSTIFKLKDYCYVLDVYDPTDPFVVLRTNPLKFQGESNDEIFKQASVERRRKAQSMSYSHTVLTFSAAASITLDIANRHNLNSIKFTAYDPVLLKNFYDALAKNKIFKQSVNESGWSFTHDQQGYYFTKL